MQIVNGFTFITKANGYDDSGLFYDESGFRKSYFDVESHDSGTASKYWEEVKSGWTASFEFFDQVHFYRVCRWREGHFLYAAPVPNTINTNYLQTNVRSLVYSVDFLERIQVLLVCGYGFFCSMESPTFKQSVSLYMLRVTICLRKDQNTSHLNPSMLVHQSGVWYRYIDWILVKLE